MQHQIEQNPFKAVKNMSEVMPTTIIMDRWAVRIWMNLM
jgi:hypothetical protein